MAVKEKKVIQVNLMLACMFEATVILEATLLGKEGCCVENIGTKISFSILTQCITQISPCPDLI